MTNNMSYSQHGVITAEGELIDGFLAAVCNDANSFDVLDQVAELEEILSLNIMSAKQNRDSLLELSALKQERNTWRLLGRLYHDELTQNQNLGQDLLNTALVSEKEVIQHAFVTDKVKRNPVYSIEKSSETNKEKKSHLINIFSILEHTESIHPQLLVSAPFCIFNWGNSKSIRSIGVVHFCRQKSYDYSKNQFHGNLIEIKCYW